VAVPAPDILPWRAIERAMSAALRNWPGSSARYDLPPGCAALRAEIARRAVEAGCALSPDELLLTSGATEAVICVCAPSPNRAT
jgi:DNA-binding transcriptional MocR family regulator